MSTIDQAKIKKSRQPEADVLTTEPRRQPQEEQQKWQQYHGNAWGKRRRRKLAILGTNLWVL